jgi:hypothetical protein
LGRTRLGYLPGHLHAFWLIYKKMRAEEAYGVGGYHYIGNGVFEPSAGASIAAPQPNYGATNV